MREGTRMTRSANGVHNDRIPIAGTVVVAMGTEVVGLSSRSGDKLWSTSLEMEAG